MSHTHHDKHEAAVVATMEATPDSAKASIGDIIKEARALNLPWAKIFSAIMTAAAGGFSPAAIAAAIAILFGSNVPPALAHMTGPTMTSTAPAV